MASKKRAGANIERGWVVIRIPIDALPDALKQNPRDDSYEDFRVLDAAGFAADVVRELNREEEDGTTPVHLLFDKVMGEAIDQGSAFVEFPKKRASKR